MSLKGLQIFNLIFFAIIKVVEMYNELITVSCQFGTTLIFIQSLRQKLSSLVVSMQVMQRWHGMNESTKTGLQIVSAEPHLPSISNKGQWQGPTQT